MASKTPIYLKLDPTVLTALRKERETTKRSAAVIVEAALRAYLSMTPKQKAEPLDAKTEKQLQKLHDEVRQMTVRVMTQDASRCRDCGHPLSAHLPISKGSSTRRCQFGQGCGCRVSA